MLNKQPALQAFTVFFFIAIGINSRSSRFAALLYHEKWAGRPLGLLFASCELESKMALAK